MTNELRPGQTRFGFLLDGRPGTPYQAAMLSYEAERGAVLTVPYVLGEEQFAHVEEWFVHQRAVPETLMFWDNEGVVTLTGLSWGGNTFAQAAKGRVVPTTVIFGRPRLFRADYRVRKLASRLDGLQAFTRFAPVEVDHRPGDGTEAVATVRPSEAITWRHGGFSFALEATAAWSSRQGGSFAAAAESALESRCSRGRTVTEHVGAQWPFRALLILAFGSPVSWRDHWATDRNFPTWMLDGSTLEGEGMRVQTRRTVADFEKDAPATTFPIPMLHAHDLGAAGIRRWFQLYDDEVFRRAIEPVVEVINGASRFLEPQLLMTAMSLEAMGHFRDPERRSGRSVESQIKRCIDATGLNWSSIGPTRGMAKAIATAYNDLKHADRGRRPGGLELGLLTPLAVMVMRLQILDLLRVPDPVRSAFTSTGLYRVTERFTSNAVRISSKGELLPAS